MPDFQQFIRERQYLADVSPSTVEWYKNSLKWLPSESPSQEQLKDVVMRIREKGPKAILSRRACVMRHDRPGGWRIQFALEEIRCRNIEIVADWQTA
jgi:hypothetical protein